MVNNIKGIPRLRPLELADRVYYTPQSQDIRSRRYWCRNSVRLSVRPAHAGIVAKRLNL